MYRTGGQSVRSVGLGAAGSRPDEKPHMGWGKRRGRARSPLLFVFGGGIDRSIRFRLDSRARKKRRISRIVGSGWACFVPARGAASGSTRPRVPSVLAAIDASSARRRERTVCDCRLPESYRLGTWPGRAGTAQSSCLVPLWVVLSRHGSHVGPCCRINLFLAQTRPIAPRHAFGSCRSKHDLQNIFASFFFHS